MSNNLTYGLFKCDKCEKDFTRKTYLTRHQKSHNSSSNKKCHQCGNSFKTGSLKDHIRNMHSDKNLNCDQCKKMFSTIKRLNNHKKLVHVFRAFKCDQCKYRAKTMSHLKAHITNVHTCNGVRDKSSKCDTCDFQGTKRRCFLTGSKFVPNLTP